MGRSQEFADFVEASAELQAVDPSGLPENERKAFFINLYNIMIVHANVVIGAPKTASDRMRFFPGVKYNVGGLVYSADDIEHGILRCNRPTPASLVRSLAGWHTGRASLTPRPHACLPPPHTHSLTPARSGPCWACPNVRARCCRQATAACTACCTRPLTLVSTSPWCAAPRAARPSGSSTAATWTAPSPRLPRGSWRTKRKWTSAPGSSPRA